MPRKTNGCPPRPPQLSPARGPQLPHLPPPTAGRPMGRILPPPFQTPLRSHAPRQRGLRTSRRPEVVGCHASASLGGCPRFTVSLLSRGIPPPLRARQGRPLQCPVAAHLWCFNALPQGCIRREGERGGGGSGTQKFVYQKWPDQIFPTANLVVSHDGHFGRDGGAGGGAPPMVVSRSDTSLPCPVPPLLRPAASRLPRRPTYVRRSHTGPGPLRAN